MHDERIHPVAGTAEKRDFPCLPAVSNRHCYRCFDSWDRISHRLRWYSRLSDNVARRHRQREVLLDPFGLTVHMAAVLGSALVYGSSADARDEAGNMWRPISVMSGLYEVPRVINFIYPYRFENIPDQRVSHGRRRNSLAHPARKSSHCPTARQALCSTRARPR